MRKKYLFNGHFTAGSREHVVGPLVVWVDECSLSVVGTERGMSRSELSIAPFHGAMLFGTIDHHQREDVLVKGYELRLSGSTLGMYADGGGAHGSYDLFKIKDVRIKGVFGRSGLTINLIANSWPGAAVCYSDEELRENAYKPIVVSTEFTVPPANLQEFMALGFSIDHEMFARFKWSDR